MTAQLIPDMPFAEYLALDRLSASGAKSLLKAPAIFKHQQDHPFEPTAAMQLGTLVHAMVLEDDVARFEIIEGGYGKGKREAEVRERGLIPVTEDTWTTAEAMKWAVWKHPLASGLLSLGEPEQTVLWEQEGVPMKARIDWLRNDVIVDLKTTTSANPSDFRRSVATFGYHVQQAIYAEAVRELTGNDLPFYFIAVESRAPYLVSVVQLDDMAAERGRELAHRAIELWADGKRTGEWPGYPELTTVSLPQWALWDDGEDEEIVI